MSARKIEYLHNHQRKNISFYYQIKNVTGSVIESSDTIPQFQLHM